ncbi:MAG: hypothetical protein JWR14_2565 [Caballeronia sp.]|nr:hypothetical protein [Caballeronia sp.]
MHAEVLHTSKTVLADQRSEVAHERPLHFAKRHCCLHVPTDRSGSTRGGRACSTTAARSASVIRGEPTES